MRILGSVLVAAVSLLPAQQAGSTAPPAVGTCILAGGGRLPKEVIARFVELAGGSEARIVLIPTASQSADDPAERDDLKKLWREERGAAVDVFHTRDRERANDEAFCAPLRAATGVWLGGGVQKRLADAYLGTRVEKELMALLARGGVIGGTSAGTAIQTRTMIQEGKENPIVATGFDLVPGAISDQHFLKRERLPRLLQVLAAHPGHVGIGVDESTAAEIQGDHLRVLGASKVVLVLAAHHGHGEIVREVASDARHAAAHDLADWRRAAQERIGWDISAPGAPGLDAGTLLLGSGDGIAARFIALAGGRDAKLVVVAESDEGVRRLVDSLRAAGATEVAALVTGAGPVDALAADAALAAATGVVFGDGHLYESDRMLDARRRWPAIDAVHGVLARGGVVWGNGIVGEVVARPWPLNDAATPPFAYRRGLGLLRGSTIVRRDLQRAADAPITDGAPHEWLYRCAARLPRITGIHVEGAALVRGSILEVLGALPTHVLPAKAEGSPGDEREKVTLEPGARWNLVARERL